jgi:hypothetical protein
MPERPDFVLLRAQYDISTQRTDVERDVLSLIAYAADLERALAAAREREARWRKAVTHGPCQCDPPGSGEELCSGGCYLQERLDRLEPALRRWLAAKEDWRAGPDGWSEKQIIAICDEIAAADAALLDVAREVRR